jgi:bifunctional non-homologous end joining protein LigD
MTAETFTVAGVPLTISHLDKPLWPGRFRKAELLAYYMAVAGVLLPYLRDRLVTVVRAPEGVAGARFFQKARPTGAPDFVPSYFWDGKEHLLVPDTPTLAYLANLAAVEIHTALWRIPHPYPDLAVVDLDPAPPAGFGEARVVALEAKQILDARGLPAFLKTSGGRGLHIFLPLEADAGFEEIRHFVRWVGEELRRRSPAGVTLRARVRDRSGVFVDVNQNGRSRTMVAPYSPRATPSATVSAPIDWAELLDVEPEDFRIDTIPSRIRTRGDPWAGIAGEAVPSHRLSTTGEDEKRALTRPKSGGGRGI